MSAPPTASSAARSKIADVTGVSGYALLAAATAVGLAIVADGQAARTINGIGGLVWVAAAGLLVISLRQEAFFWPRIALATGLALALVLLVRPSDYPRAAVGFAIAGAVIGLTATHLTGEWALTVPGLWLPLHLIVAIGRVVERSVHDLPAHVRTEPPPTAALVPLTMVVTAWAGGVLIEILRARRGRAKASRPDWTT